MFPQATDAPFTLVVEAVATFTLHQAFPLARVLNDDDAKFRVYLPFACPVTAGRANLDLCWHYKF